MERSGSISERWSARKPLLPLWHKTSSTCLRNKPLRVLSVVLGWMIACGVGAVLWKSALNSLEEEFYLKCENRVEVSVISKPLKMRLSPPFLHPLPQSISLPRVPDSESGLGKQPERIVCNHRPGGEPARSQRDHMGRIHSPNSLSAPQCEGAGVPGACAGQRPCGVRGEMGWSHHLHQRQQHHRAGAERLRVRAHRIRNL